MEAEAFQFNNRFLDPRMGLFLLLAANVIAFSEKPLWLEIGWIGFILFLLLVSGHGRSAVKWLAVYLFIMALQWYILPVSPKWIATSFSIFTNYSRRMFACLLVGNLMIKNISLREMIVGLRKLHMPQKLIIPISVTLRYFPAIREETGYIRDAMRLRNIRGMEKVEAMVVPLMISATETAEELSAAAVTRGIENPAKKTSLVELHMGIWDGIGFIAAILFIILLYLAQGGVV